MALILTRKPGEKIYIDGEKIKIMVSKVFCNQVTLMIDAPDDVSIHREEIYMRIANGSVSDDEKNEPSC